VGTRRVLAELVAQRRLQLLLQHLLLPRRPLVVTRLLRARLQPRRVRRRRPRVHQHHGRVRLHAMV